MGLLLRPGFGALANFNGLHLPVTATTKVFLSHLHADHVGDMPTLVWSLAKSGRRDPVAIAQDLTTFTITQEAVITRQTVIDPFAWPVVGPTEVTGPSMSAPNPSPAWWSDALIAD